MTVEFEPAPSSTKLGGSQRFDVEEATAAQVRGDLHALHALVEGTAGGTGQEFFRSLVRHLASAMEVRYAVVVEFTSVPSRMRMMALWARDKVVEGIEYDLAGTPCEVVAGGEFAHFPSGVSSLFPNASMLVELGIDGYMGVPFKDSDGNVLGHLAVFDERPLPAEPRRLFILKIFAARATAELQRLQAELRLRENERRYRDLYEEAPVGYLCVNVAGNILSVNRQAIEAIGYSAAELHQLSVLQLFADSPAGKSRVTSAFQRLLDGEEPSGVEVELVRRDGRPLWISLLMRPIHGDDGRVEAIRAVWVDITARILAEAERARLEQQNQYLQDEIKATHNFEEIVGQSPALMAVLDNVRSVAPTEASVLIAGETGTGKELIARAIHSASKRKDKPLIKVNCAAFPTGLVESELFGHEKGAFTGAIARRIGRFELAQGGTIFLDEIGEIPPETQAKLLRVLQEREFERVGGSEPIRVDVRVLAATNRDLLDAVRAKSFREDLYYRLNVFPVSVPPLRERKEDIVLLVHFLVHKFANKLGKRIDPLDRQTLDRLTNYAWPGNVRELENVLERAVILTSSSKLKIDPAVLMNSSSAPAGPTGPPTLMVVERDHVVSVLEQTEWVIDGPRGAALVLGLHPNTLRNRMKKLGIVRPSQHSR